MRTQTLHHHLILSTEKNKRKNENQLIQTNQDKSQDMMMVKLTASNPQKQFIMIQRNAQTVAVKK